MKNYRVFFSNGEWYDFGGCDEFDVMDRVRDDAKRNGIRIKKVVKI